jgi:hypothetical protein
VSNLQSCHQGTRDFVRTIRMLTDLIQSFPWGKVSLDRLLPLYIIYHIPRFLRAIEQQIRPKERNPTDWIRIFTDATKHEQQIHMPKCPFKIRRSVSLCGKSLFSNGKDSRQEERQGPQEGHHWQVPQEESGVILQLHLQGPQTGSPRHWHL